MVASKFLEASWFDLMRDDSISSERGLRALLYAATRESVLHGSDDEFDFAHYLSVALGRTLAEIVEVPVKTWLGLEVALLVFFVLDSYVLSSTIFHVVVWSLLAWSGLVASYVVHAKLASVLRSHLEPHLRKALDADLFDEVPPPFADDDTFFSPQGSMDDDVEARDAPTRLQEVKIEESSLLSGSADSSPRRPRPPLTNQTSLAGSADATKKKKPPPYARPPSLTSVDVAKKMRLAKKNYDDDDDNDAADFRGQPLTSRQAGRPGALKNVQDFFGDVSDYLEDPHATSNWVFGQQRKVGDVIDANTGLGGGARR
mmetsp:Transcript_26583/g.86002  ORF Transcript_26583/g.86002 Transcript_26583/m.86002 type:complete len:315 (-) Transcript_26583:217-1161(-)